MKGNDPNKDSLIVNSSFSIVPGHDHVIANSTKYSYNDHGFQWDTTGKNGFYSRFKYEP